MPAWRRRGWLREPQSVSHSSDDHEQVQTVRVDYNINPSDTAWFRFQSDTGLQAAWTDPINPVFDAFSRSPSILSRQDIRTSSRRTW